MGRGVTRDNSLAMICLAANKAECDKLMVALNRGPNTFSVPIRDKVTLLRTAYCAHTYDDDLADSLTAVPQVLPPGVVLADLQAEGFTAATARAAVGKIKFRVLTGRASIANVKARLDLEGWEFEPSPAL